MDRRNNRTDIALQSKGWVKVGKKHYENVTGQVIKYDCMSYRWVWYDKDGNALFNFHALWVAVAWIEKKCADPSVFD